MNKKEILLTVLSVSVLSACASRNHEPPTRAERLSSIKAQYETVAEERKGAATVAYGWTRFTASGKTEMPAKHLRIIHPSHSTQVVALKTLGLLLGGSYQGSDKKDLKGDSLPNVPNRSLSAAYRPVRDYVLGKYGGEDGAAYFPLYVGGTVIGFWCMKSLPTAGAESTNWFRKSSLSSPMKFTAHLIMCANRAVWQKH
nr:hypothetical protein LVJ77_07250 [Conchiformibius kuhniae]